VSTAAGWDGVLEHIAKRQPGVAALYMLSFLFLSLTILMAKDRTAYSLAGVATPSD